MAAVITEPHWQRALMEMLLYRAFVKNSIVLSKP